MSIVHWLTQAYGRERYADFKSCSDRKEWLGLILFQIMAYCTFIALGVVCNLLVVTADEVITWPIYLTTSLVFVFALYSFVPGLALTVRRLHDIGVSGWWSLCYFLPPLMTGLEVQTWIVNALVVLGIFVMLLPSKKENNRFRV